MPNFENTFQGTEQAGDGGDGADPQFSAYAASPFYGPTLDLSYGGDFPDGFDDFSGLKSAARILYEEFIDELGCTYIVRTDLETKRRERFVLPPPTARD